MKTSRWKNLVVTAAVLALAAAIPGAKAAQSFPAKNTPESFRVLVFSRTLGYRHASITNGIAAIRELGRQNSFAVESTEDPRVFESTNLAHYAAVVFLSVTGDVLKSDQEAALRSYVTGGGGFVGIHGAAFGPLACEEKWGWYGDLFCCAFKNHSAVVPGVIHLEDPTHPANAGLPDPWARSEEWYNFTGTPRGCARVLATVDEGTYRGGTMGQDHPMVWCRQVGQGRMWYTAMGHTESSFDEPLFRQHLLNGILVAAGIKPGDFTPNSSRPGNYTWSKGSGILALHARTNVVWQFNFGAHLTKPYFHPVALPDGPILTWDQPTDHPWHHALWFAWKYINQVNYWETEGLPPAERGITQWRDPEIQLRADFSAAIVMDLAYHPPNGPTALTEHRIIQISSPAADRSYSLDWEATFTAAGKEIFLDRTPLTGEPGGQPWGGYAGLSVRFARDIQAPRAVTSQSVIDLASGKYRGHATALDYTGSFDGHEAGIAVLDHSANRNSPSSWYVISDSTMHYFSPAVVQDGPLRLAPGEKLTLRYRVVVHSGHWTPERLRDAVETFGRGY